MGGPYTPQLMETPITFAILRLLETNPDRTSPELHATELQNEDPLHRDISLDFPKHTFEKSLNPGTA